MSQGAMLRGSDMRGVMSLPVGTTFAVPRGTFGPHRSEIDGGAMYTRLVQMQMDNGLGTQGAAAPPPTVPSANVQGSTYGGGGSLSLQSSPPTTTLPQGCPYGAGGGSLSLQSNPPATLQQAPMPQGPYASGGSVSVKSNPPNALHQAWGAGLGGSVSALPSMQTMQAATAPGQTYAMQQVQYQQGGAATLPGGSVSIANAQGSAHPGGSISVTPGPQANTPAFQVPGGSVSIAANPQAPAAPNSTAVQAALMQLGAPAYDTLGASRQASPMPMRRASFAEGSSTEAVGGLPRAASHRVTMYTSEAHTAPQPFTTPQSYTAPQSFPAPQPYSAPPQAFMASPAASYIASPVASYTPQPNTVQTYAQPQSTLVLPTMPPAPYAPPPGYASPAYASPVPSYAAPPMAASPMAAPQLAVPPPLTVGPKVAPTYAERPTSYSQGSKLAPSAFAETAFARGVSGSNFSEPRLVYSQRQASFNEQPNYVVPTETYTEQSNYVLPTETFVEPSYTAPAQSYGDPAAGYQEPSLVYDGNNVVSQRHITREELMSDGSLYLAQEEARAAASAAYDQYRQRLPTQYEPYPQAPQYQQSYELRQDMASQLDPYYGQQQQQPQQQGSSLHVPMVAEGPILDLQQCKQELEPPLLYVSQPAQYAPTQQYIEPRYEDYMTAPKYSPAMPTIAVGPEYVQEMLK